MKTPDELSLGIAARCWCDEETESITMDTALATAFAKRVQVLTDELELAWGIIANAYGGDWELASKASGWKKAAIAWRDRYHKIIDSELPSDAAGGGQCLANPS